MPNLSMPLSNNFTLGEFLRSDVAERQLHLKEDQENPPEEIVNNLQYLVETTLQPIRDLIDYPIRITSGYRSPLLNKIIGGSPTSQHCKGEAADCQLLPRFLYDAAAENSKEKISEQIRDSTTKNIKPDINENFYLFSLICLNLDDLDVDQVIHEYGEDFGRPSWIHVSASRRLNKRQILAIGNYTNHIYLQPSVNQAVGYGTI